MLAVDIDPDRRASAAATGAQAVDPVDPRLPMALRAAAVAYECTADERVLWELSSALAPGSGLVLVAHHQGGTLSAGQLLDRWHTGAARAGGCSGTLLSCRTRSRADQERLIRSGRSDR